MTSIEKYNQKLAKEIKSQALENQLNVLIGSGCSADGMPLMSQYRHIIDKEEANKQMVSDIMRRSKLSINGLNANTRAMKSSIGKKIGNNQIVYTNFISAVIDLLNITNSRQVPRMVNIFTTNYDLFIENAISKLHSQKRFVFNDGANGYFQRILDSTNYNRVVSYKGLNDNYISEIPSLNLIKSHGSVNWEHRNDKLIVLNDVSETPMIVPPTGFEAQETFLNNYFHDMLRVFQLELDKPQSVLLVIGFSFQDQHISKMLTRALQNPELIVYVFIFRGEGNDVLQNLKVRVKPSNLKIITPNLIYSDQFVNSHIKDLSEQKEHNVKHKSLFFTLENLTEILVRPDTYVDIKEDVEYEE